MITEDYVSFETAKLLKEKGFDKYPVFPCYKEDNGEFIDIPTTLDTINYCFIPAPTLQMAMKWLREIYHIHITVYPYGEYSCDNYQFDVYKNNNFVVSKDDGYATYEQACEAAIKYCLKNLIERYKEDKQKDKVNEPFAIVTNCKTEKYFYAKNFNINLNLKTHPCLDAIVTITPKDLNDIVPVIGKHSLSDCITKKECIGDNEKLHIEVFDENNIKQDEYFIYNVWVQSINYETNIIILCCDYVN